MAKIFYVDVPDQYNIGANGEWAHISTFSSKEEAIKFVRENIDNECSDDGKITIVTEGDDGEN